MDFLAASPSAGWRAGAGAAWQLLRRRGSKSRCRPARAPSGPAGPAPRASAADRHAGWTAAHSPETAQRLAPFVGDHLHRRARLSEPSPGGGDAEAGRGSGRRPRCACRCARGRRRRPRGQRRAGQRVWRSARAGEGRRAEVARRHRGGAGVGDAVQRPSSVSTMRHAPARQGAAAIATGSLPGSSTSAKRGRTSTRSKAHHLHRARGAATLPAWLVCSRMKRVGIGIVGKIHGHFARHSRRRRIVDRSSPLPPGQPMSPRCTHAQHRRQGRPRAGAPSSTAPRSTSKC